MKLRDLENLLLPTDNNLSSAIGDFLTHYKILQHIQMSKPLELLQLKKEKIWLLNLIFIPREFQI